MFLYRWVCSSGRVHQAAAAEWSENGKIRHYRGYCRRVGSLVDMQLTTCNRTAVLSISLYAQLIIAVSYSGSCGSEGLDDHRFEHRFDVPKDALLHLTLKRPWFGLCEATQPSQEYQRLAIR